MGCREFDKALLNAVDFTFDSFGKSFRHTLYFHLGVTFHIGRTKIPKNVEDFDYALRAIFKDGAILLEKLILRKLCEELEVKFKEKNLFDFVETVSEIRSMALERKLLLTMSNFGEEVAIVERKHGGRKIEA